MQYRRPMFYLENMALFRNLRQIWTMQLSFDDTKTAFAYKSSRELKNARFLFSSMSSPLLVNLGLKLTPVLLKYHIPVKGLIRKYLFNQFVGGETLQETDKVADNLAKYGVTIILDYGVEGKEGEENYDQATQVFVDVVRYAGPRANVPFMSIKMTGIARFELLEKIHNSAVYADVVRGELNLSALSPAEKAEWRRVIERLDKICAEAAATNVGVLVDAEHSWIQHPVDALVTQMMEKYNRQNVVLYNTAQLYRSDRLQFIRDNNEWAMQRGYKTGMKLVRGAYMEAERERAREMGYPSPINPTKEATDDMYNAALDYCIDPQNQMYIIIGSHNEYSNLLGAELLEQYNLPRNAPQVYFSQLYGMSDQITFNLAKAGCNASKYLPFGPMNDVIPYLMRRAEENSSVNTQSNRELTLIRQEIHRRSIT